MKKAFITGITGQDGSYLAEFLLNKNYEVHGLKRRSSSLNTSRIDHIYNDPMFHLHYGDLTDSLSMLQLIKKINPDEIYNLAAQSHVKVSFELPEYTSNVNALGTLRILDIILQLNLQDKCKFYQASSSELYGLIQEYPQNEDTKFYPRSPYAISKLFAYWITVNYREAYNLFACNGILFNHESERRGETFVTRKVTIGLAKICNGYSTCLYLGNLNSLRDWGHASDYVEMQWLMLQQAQPEDYVISSGQQFSVKQFVETAAKFLGIELEWVGQGLEEVGRIKKIFNKKYIQSPIKENDIIIRIDPKYFRATEVENLLGDSSKAMKKLKWKPKISFEDMVKKMTMNDLKI